MSGRQLHLADNNEARCLIDRSGTANSGNRSRISAASCIVCSTQACHGRLDDFHIDDAPTASRGAHGYQQEFQETVKRCNQDF